MEPRPAVAETGHERLDSHSPGLREENSVRSATHRRREQRCGQSEGADFSRGDASGIFFPVAVDMYRFCFRGQVGSGGGGKHVRGLFSNTSYGVLLDGCTHRIHTYCTCGAK